MSIIVDCPSCGGKLRVPDELLGRRVKCPKCRLEFQAGAAASPPAAAPSLGPSAELPPPEPHVPPTSSAATPPPPDQSSEDERPWEQPWPAVRRDCEPHRGTMILVFGILSLVFMGIIGLPLGIAAWVMGHKDLRRMRNREMDPEGLGTTQAGWVCGIIGTILGGLLSVCTCMYIVFVFAAIWATAVPTLPPPPPPTPPPAPGNFQGGGVPLALADYLPRLRW